MASLELIDTDITTLKILFQERFSVIVVETSVVSFDLELSKLYYCYNKIISSYYKKVCSPILRIGIQDQLSDTKNELFLLELATLGIIKKAFVKNLANEDVKKNTIQGLSIGDYLLYGMYNLAKDAL